MAPVPATRTVQIVSRSEWGARKPKATSTLTTPVTYLIIHHTAGCASTDLASGKRIVKGIQDFHMDTRGWDDIGYSFLIGTDGTVFEGRGWNKVGAHTSGYNTNGLGVSLLGNFTNVAPSSKALSSAKALIAEGVEKGYLKSDYVLKGHRQMGSTECPGNKLFEIIKTWPHFIA